MRYFTKFILATLSAATLLSAPAFAQIGFDSTVTSPLTQAVKIEIELSESMAHRANNLPKKISMRSSGGRLNSGFSSNGFYGDKDLQQLQDRLASKLTKQFEKYGVETSDTSSTVLKVTLEDARNNRPTFEQLSREVGLSFQSFGNGGAEINAQLVGPNSEDLGRMSYSFFENDIRDARFGGTWSDANRAIDRFAKKSAKSLANPSNS